MRNFIRKHQSFVSYTFFGTLASGVNLIVFHILYQNIGINYVVANVISYICGMLVTFFTNKRLVFHSEYDSVKKLIREFLSFCNGRLFSFFLDNFIMVVGIGIFPVNADLLKIIDQCIVGILNYFFSIWFIFNTTNRFQVNVLSKRQHDKTREESNPDRDELN